MQVKPQSKNNHGTYNYDVLSVDLFIQKNLKDMQGRCLVMGGCARTARLCAVDIVL